MHFDSYAIRPVSTNDVEDFFNLIENNRKRLESFFAGTVAQNKDLQATRIFISSVIEKAKERTYFSFVIIETFNHRLIGYIDMKNIDWNIPKAELGCFIDKQYERKGIATKALAKVIEYCFEDMKFNKLFLRTHESNTGSKRIAEKNKFKLEGVLRNDYKTTDGTLLDLLYYGLLNTGVE
ncbi:MAG: GNAT family N-acetyltransferase [Fimbriimonadaceae bacterium]|nr:GNAT family N-acetyltransferase [Chitinophagales bacterium]